MKRSKKPIAAAEAAKRLGISQEQLEAQVQKQVEEELGIHPLTPQEKLELEEQTKAYSSIYETFRRDTRRRAGVPVPFPLPDIYYSTDDTEPSDGVYDHDDPEYLERTSLAAYGAINDYRMFFYKPGLYLNKEQLKLATDVALEIRAQKHDLKNIPLAENPDCPTDKDFIRLGQWFLDAHTAITKDISSQTAKEKTGKTDSSDVASTKKKHKKYTVELLTRVQATFDHRRDGGMDVKGAWNEAAEAFGLKSGKAAEMACRRYHLYGQNK